MPSVDDRIVRMEFDNAAFERKMQTTLASLDQLNKALKFQGATKGLSDINTAAKKMDFNNVSNGIENVSKKFIAMSTIAITALARVTESAISAGARIAKSLTLDNIISGFKEYELNIGSIQTILANTKADGTNLKQVNAALDELNTFADKTIFNFGEMTRNIGTFTAAGVDLGTSVQSIKGIANLAAISGSSSEQAATAMYQLSQAISTGTLKLIDWNSVVNAGMGGEVFQKALFETGKALKTIPGVPISETFEEWTKGGNSFRSSLEKGWLTSEVLTTTLQGFTGEMTEAQLLTKGFTKEQAKNIIELGKTGVDAATQVRTLTQLLSTTKEAIGSGWSASFRIIIGNFEEATELFSGINKFISKIVNRSADARNALLSGFAAFGGRKVLFDSLFLAVHNLGLVLKPIKEAFRGIFPKTTVTDLLKGVLAFKKFAEALRPSTETVEKLRRIFRGFFSALSIGWEIVKQGVKFIGELAHSLGSAFGPGFLEFLAKIGDVITGLNIQLVRGGAIKDFFAGLTEIIKQPIPFLQKIGDVIKSIFTGFDDKAGDAVSASVGRIGDRFKSLKAIFDRFSAVLEPVKRVLSVVGQLLGKIGSAVGKAISSMMDAISNALSSGEFDNALDALNTALFGGFLLLLRKFLKNGAKLNIDFGKGIFKQIEKTFGQLTGVLKAMQTQIKAQALEKIAIAIGILTASVLVLSLIDSKALTKALTAMAVGFGQLMAAFAILNQITVGPSSAAQFALISGGMILLAGAVTILAGAVTIFGKLDNDELTRGLIGVAGALTIVIAATIPLSNISPKLIIAGAALGILGVALTILGGAVKIFSLLKLGDMAKGLLGIGAALLIIGGAAQAMPVSLPITAAGLVILSVALSGLAGAIKLFASIPLGDLAKGIIAIAGGLILIGGAMQVMPATLPITGAGLILVSIGLGIMAKALQSIGGMSWGEIAKGLVTLAGAFIILAPAMIAMSAAVLGAPAFFVLASALGVFVTVLKAMGKMDWGDLIQGMLKIAAALGILGLTALLLTPVIPLIAALGVALGILGVAFAIFAAGAFLAAKAFEILSKSSSEGTENLISALENLGKAIPAFSKGLAEGFVEFFQVIADNAPKLIESFGKMISQLLQQTVKMAPQMGLAFTALALQGIQSFVALTPFMISAGLNFLITLLKGINDNIGLITTTVVGIVTGFITSLASPENMNKIIGAGLVLLVSFLNGIANNIGTVITAATNVVTKFIQGIAQNVGRIVTAGANAIISFVTGLGKNASRVISAGVTAVINFIKGLGQNAAALAGAAFDVVIQFIKGLRQTIDEKGEELREQGRLLVGAIINGMTLGLAGKAKELGDKVAGTLEGAFKKGKSWLKVVGDPYSLKFMAVGEAMINGVTRAFDKDSTMEASTVDLVSRSTDAFRGALSTISSRLGDMDEFNPTITPVLDLTKVAADASKINELVKTTPISPSFSFSQAKTIASTSTATPKSDSEKSPGGTSGGPSFTQIINAPERLSSAEIYKQTRNQITMAKEELNIS